MSEVNKMGNWHIQPKPERAEVEQKLEVKSKIKKEVKQEPQPEEPKPEDES